jgi:hypothetical protein
MVGQRARINLPLTAELLARIDAALRSAAITQQRAGTWIDEITSIFFK